DAGRRIDRHDRRPHSRRARTEGLMSAAQTRARRGLPPAAPIPVPSDKRFRRSEVRQSRRPNWRRLLIRSGWVAGAAVVVLGFVFWISGLLIDAPVLRV